MGSSCFYSKAIGKATDHWDGGDEHDGAGGSALAGNVGRNSGDDAADDPAEVEQDGNVGGLLRGDVNACGGRQ